VKVTRVYTGLDERTHFDEIDIPLFDAGDIGRLSEIVPATGIIFRENAADYDYDWHPAPCRQYVVLLEGAIESEVGDGETRRFQGGDVLLLEDTSGRGHRTRTVDDRPRRSLFLRLE
jgi:hypothetical protein